MIAIQSCNVTVMVNSLDASIKFYTETLGFSLKNRYGEHWADIEGPGISIGLHPNNKEIKVGDNLQIGLKVPDVMKAISELEKKGVAFNINNADKVKLAAFKDPDGNTLYLVQ